MVMKRSEQFFNIIRTFFIGAVFPGSGNTANAYNNNNPNPNQRVQKTASPTTRRTVTTRRVVQTTATVRTPVKAQKKPQTKS
jgi:hypothetical protein